MLRIIESYFHCSEEMNRSQAILFTLQVKEYYRNIGDLQALVLVDVWIFRNRYLTTAHVAVE